MRRWNIGGFISQGLLRLSAERAGAIVSGERLRPAGCPRASRRGFPRRRRDRARGRASADASTRDPAFAQGYGGQAGCAPRTKVISRVADFVKCPGARSGYIYSADPLAAGRKSAFDCGVALPQEACPEAWRRAGRPFPPGGTATRLRRTFGAASKRRPYRLFLNGAALRPGVDNAPSTAISLRRLVR